MATRHAPAQATRDRKSPVPGENTSLSVAIRDFGGINQRDPRDCIGDNEFYWLEEIAPVSRGNLVPAPGPGTVLSVVGGETGAPSYTMAFNALGVDYIFAVWANSGNGWIVNVSNGVATHIISGFTSGQTAAAQWSNLGLLIVDPVQGYFDWNITTPATLTPLSGQAMNVTIDPNIASFGAGGTVATIHVSDASGPGVGGLLGASITVVQLVIMAGSPGTGYLPGDVLVENNVGSVLTTDPKAPIATQNTRLSIQVTAVGAGGAVTGISILNPGFYQSIFNPLTFTGGSGTGLQCSGIYKLTEPWIKAPGHGYVAPYASLVVGGAALAGWKVQTSGTILGTSVAVYAGRAWIAINRTVQFTDADSFSSFGASGSAFTINDSYLHNNITALFAANNYLYIFAADSIDILSNVQVNADGLASFSRVNVTASIGTTQPTSIFAFSRTIAFANSTGFYLLSGSTPQKISDEINGIIGQLVVGTQIYGGQISYQNDLCPVFTMRISDFFISGGTQRQIALMQIKGRWWVSAQLTANGGPHNVVTVPAGDKSTLYGWAQNAPALYPFYAAANGQAWQIFTKLWDFGEPMTDKTSLLAAIGAVVGGAASSGIQVFIQSSNLISDPTLIATSPPEPPNPTGYQLFLGSAPMGGQKCLGLQISGNSNTAQVRLIAIDAEATRRW